MVDEVLVKPSGNLQIIVEVELNMVNCNKPLVLHQVNPYQNWFSGEVEFGGGIIRVDLLEDRIAKKAPQIMVDLIADQGARLNRDYLRNIREIPSLDSWTREAFSFQVPNRARFPGENHLPVPKISVVVRLVKGVHTKEVENQ